MNWSVRLHDAFEPEFKSFALSVQNELLAVAKLLADFGPALGRPQADTLKGSDYANMKELRFRAADGVWRVAFAFDPAREAILLVAGDKSGVSGDKFYQRVIEKADKRYAQHLEQLKQAKPATLGRAK
jgi:hypothetical protein